MISRKEQIERVLACEDDVYDLIERLEKFEKEGPIQFGIWHTELKEIIDDFRGIFGVRA